MDAMVAMKFWACSKQSQQGRAEKVGRSHVAHGVHGLHGDLWTSCAPPLNSQGDHQK